MGFLSLAAIATAIPCLAQTAARPGVTRMPSDDERIVALLKSTDPRDQAWGAWHAGRDRRHQLQPLLKQIVVSRIGAVGVAESAARDQAVDALIQMEGTIEADVLPLLHEHRPAEALILAANAPEVPVDFLLDVLRTENGDQWFAAANMLLTTRPPGLAFTILRDLKIHVTIYITTHGNGPYGSGGGGPSGAGCGAAGSTPGLPPWPSYDLTTSGRPGVIVLAVGPNPVYYTRRVSLAGLARGGGIHVTTDPTSHQRLQYIGALLFEDPARLPVRGAEFHSIKWSGDRALQSEIERIRADIDSRLRLLTGQLQSHDLISAQEVQALPANMIEQRVEDIRTTRQ